MKKGQFLFVFILTISLVLSVYINDHKEAKQMEVIQQDISSIQADIHIMQRSDVSRGGIDKVDELARENQSLRNEVESLKNQLELAGDWWKGDK